MIRTRVIRELTTAGGRFIAAASGLVRAGEFLYVIADDEREIGVFPAAGHGPGWLARFRPGDLPADPAERKRQKPDLEALALLPPTAGFGAGGALLALESGSRPQRRRGVLWALGERGALDGDARSIDLCPLYEALDREIPDLNVEGATVAGDQLLLFQRGNGPGGVNAVVQLDLERALRDLSRATLEAGAVRAVRRLDLGTAAGARLCFSDAAALGDGRILFSAVAESIEDTYADAPLGGAGVGLLDAWLDQSGWESLEPSAKVEGIEAEDRDGRIELLMVADADDRGSPSPLLAAELGGELATGVAGSGSPA